MINEQIRVPEVRVIDENGNQLGVMPAYTARSIAEGKQLDLVEISPNAKPPVCKIMDYGKYRFDQIKKEKEARKNQTKVELKELQMTPTTDVGDIEVRVRNAVKFIQAGNKVKVVVKMKGRQQARPENAKKVLEEFYEKVKEYAVLEKAPIVEGRNVTMIIAPIVKK